MKKVSIKYVILLFAIAIISCNKEEINSNPDINTDLAKEGYVQFTLGTETKTEYGSDLQINWKDGDQIKIFCSQADDVKEANYTVNKNTASPKDGTLSPNANGLKWNKEWQKHDFYAAYPIGDTYVKSMTDGIATVKYPTNQNVTFSTKTGNVYNTVCDMNNAIMLASALNHFAWENPDNITDEKDKEQAKKGYKKISLTFKPVMTTLDITVNGPSVENTIAQITGVSIIITNDDGILNNGEFKVNLNNNPFQIQTGTKQTSTETIFVQLVNSNTSGDNAISLATGESIKLKAFLPPVLIDATNTIKIRVHQTGSATVSATIGEFIAQSSKRNIELPKIAPKVGNNWITPLDGKIYVSQMSIPGATHSATGGKMPIVNGGGTDRSTQFAVQYFPVDYQWEIGIRAFDVRGDVYTYWLPPYTKSICTCHGSTWQELYFKEYIEILINKLKENPGEFAIVFLKLDSGFYGASWPEVMGNEMQDLLNTYSQYIYNQPFRKDLKIEELRGKILFITRDYNSDGNKSAYNNGPIGAYITHWPCGDNTTKPAGAEKGWYHNLNADNKLFVENNLKGTGTESANLAIQDYYKIWQDKDGKTKNIKGFLKYSANFNKDDKFINTWCINHVSCYGMHSIGAGGDNLPSSDSYAGAAYYIIPEIYKYLKNEHNGSTGILMLPFVGSRKSLATTYYRTPFDVWGDLLPQMVIDNNYKIRMRRQGDNGPVI